MTRTPIYTCLLFILFLLPAPLIFAQSHPPSDSLNNEKDTTYVRYFIHSFDSLALGKLHTANTFSLDGFQRYDPLQRDGDFRASLGNPGLAYHNLVYNPNYKRGFNLGLNSFEKYTLNDENTPYFIHKIPITFLSYDNGSKKEQLFRAYHSQNIGKNITVGADFFLINSPGAYFRQKSDDKSVVLNAKYNTKNERYGIIVNYTHNKFIVHESGGIQIDSVFENNLQPDRSLIDVNLKTGQNKVKDAGFYAEQYFSFRKADTIPDTLRSKTEIFNPGRVSYSFRYHKNIQVYSDQEPTNEYYKQFYERFGPISDSSKTIDSLLVVSLTHRLSWSNAGINEDQEKKYFYLRLSAEHQHSEISGYAEKKQFNTFSPSAEIIIRPVKTMKLKFDGYYTKGDFNDGGYRLYGIFSQKFNFWKNHTINLSLISYELSQEPAYFYQYYQSNYFNWENNFTKERTRDFSIQLSLNKIRIGIDYMNIRHMVYMDQEARPWQDPGNFNLFRVRFSQHLQIKTFNFDYQLVYQHATNENIIRLPELLARGAVYFTLPVFKSAAILQPGLDMFYNTAYYGDAYMPATRSFYLQDNKKIGNFIYADIYLNLMIKTFRIFAKYTNISGFFGDNFYYMVPHYPMQDPTFKFGITWVFYN